MPAVVTNKTRLQNTKNFIEAFSEKSPDYGYLFIGRSTAWTDELTPPTPDYSTSGEVAIFDELIALKKIQSANVKQIAKRFDWESGQIYDPYDDEEVDIINRTNPMYVLTDDGNVYKCIDRPAGTVSTVKPTGQALGLTTTGDGYVWKFMYSLSVSEVQNFLTADWMPVEKLISDDGSPQWDVQQAAVDGAVYRVKVLNGGSGYTTATVNVDSGDGVNFAATANINGGAIESITVTNPGSDYRNISLSISGDGVDAEIQGVISPRGGHGANPVEELNGIYAMVKVQLVESESGDFPTDTSFRRVGILLNPVTTDTTGTELLVSSPAGDFAPGDTITGQTSGATGTVVTWNYETNKLVLSDTVGVFQIENIQNQDSLSAVVSEINTNVNIPATELTYPAAEIEKDVGDLVYLENRIAITRNDSQTEDIRLIVEF